MTICLYQHSKEEAFRLCEQTLEKLGFTIPVADKKKGFISARKQQPHAHRCIFMDVRLKGNIHATTINLISDIFSVSTGSFHADETSGELFLEVFHEFLLIRKPDNPFKLSKEDYALAAGF